MAANSKRKNAVRVTFTPLEACSYAAALLKGAGFVFSHAGGGSTSCYYGFPGRIGLLRVGTHKGRKPKDKRFGANNSVAALTFSNKAVRDDGTYQRSADGMENEIAQAIGRFMLNSARSE